MTPYCIRDYLISVLCTVLLTTFKVFDVYVYYVNLILLTVVISVAVLCNCVCVCVLLKSRLGSLRPIC